MRFSLGTFVLLILLISSIYAAVMLNEPWYDAGRVGISQVEFNAMHFTNISPDGTKRVGWKENLQNPYGFVTTVSGDDFVGIFENKPGGALLYPLTTDRYLFVNYKSEMEIELVKYADIAKPRSDLNIIYTRHVFRRRYANTILGHAMRPEALVGVVCALLLLLTFVKKLTSPSDKPPPPSS